MNEEQVYDAIEEIKILLEEGNIIKVEKEVKHRQPYLVSREGRPITLIIDGEKIEVDWYSYDD